MDHVGAHVAEEHPGARAEVDVRPLDDPDTAQGGTGSGRVSSRPSPRLLAGSARHDIGAPSRKASNAACRSGLPSAATLSSAAAAWLVSRSCIVGRSAAFVSRSPSSERSRIRSQISAVASSSSPAGTTRVTSPSSAARLASTRSREIEQLLRLPQPDHEREQLRRPHQLPPPIWVPLKTKYAVSSARRGRRRAPVRRRRRRRRRGSRTRRASRARR